MIFDRHKLAVNYYRLQRSLGKVMFLHVSVILFTRGWYPSMHCRWYPSMPCSRSPGGIPECLAGLQVHTQRGSWGVWPGGGVSRPTPGGWCLQVHTQGVSRPTPRGVSPDPHLGEVSRPPPKGRKGVSSPTPGWSPGPQQGGLQAHTWGVSQHAQMATAADSTHPTGMHSYSKSNFQKVVPSEWISLDV